MLPDVGSMTTLFPGTSLPSFSAASTIAFAIRSLTEPPAETNSSLPTVKRGNDTYTGSDAARMRKRTEITLEALLSRNLVETDEGRVAHSIEGIVEYCSWRERHGGRRDKLGVAGGHV